jgi:hypothetical protein
LGGRGLREVGGVREKMEISDGPESRMRWDSSSVTIGCLIGPEGIEKKPRFRMRFVPIPFQLRQKV